MEAGRRVGVWMVLLGAALVVTAGLSWASWHSEPAQEPVPERHTIEVAARRYAFTPARIEVHENDLVKIVLSTEDIAHSFTIDEYRIAKRAAPGRPVTFEFRADKAGTFVFYCNLTTEEGCKKMRGEFVVRPR